MTIHSERHGYTWIYILKELKEKTGRNISLLRLDSVVWQLGKIMYASKYERKASMKEIRRYMIEKIGVNAELAERFAEKLTLNIVRVKCIFSKNDRC